MRNRTDAAFPEWLVLVLVGMALLSIALGLMPGLDLWLR
jgi:hypothetical protein